MDFFKCAFQYSNSSKEEAEIHMLGAPFDSTTSFRPGSRFAPNSIRESSWSLENYSLEQGKSITNLKICDLGNLFLSYNAKKSINKITAAIDELNFPVVVGGEHTVTLGIVKSLKKRYDNMSVFHLDAHADLRREYGEEKISHATVMYYVGEEIGYKNLYQFGVRSAGEDEIENTKKTNFYPLYKYDTKKIIREIERMNIKDPVYVSIDIDALDCAFAPGTGNTEPCGISVRDLLDIIYKLSKFNVIGFDLVEVNPLLDNSNVTSITAAKIIFEAILAFKSPK